MFVAVIAIASADEPDLEALSVALTGPAGCYDLPYEATGTGWMGPIVQRGVARFEDHCWTMAHVDDALSLAAIGSCLLMRSDGGPSAVPSAVLSGRLRVPDRRGRPVPTTRTVDARPVGADRVTTYTAASADRRAKSAWDVSVELVTDPATGALRSLSVRQSWFGWVETRTAALGPLGLPTREVVDRAPVATRAGQATLPPIHVEYTLGAPAPCAQVPRAER